MDRQYVDAVRLLLAVAPVIFESPHFALKGGTAINLFVQDLPRLSVDIDVVFTDHVMEREQVLKTIGEELLAAKARLEYIGYSATLHKTQKGDEAKLLVANQASQVKVEVNFVFRGTLLPVTHRALVNSARDLFTTAMELPVLAIPELYGSKLVAALDRQHPRDWFDVVAMMDRFGLEAEIVDCFVAYVLTGTPLENKLEELISIVQFVDQHRLGPAWKLLHEHQVKDEAGRVTGYTRLEKIGETLAPVMIRRSKSEVLQQLPERTDQNLLVPMTEMQMIHHQEKPRW